MAKVKRYEVSVRQLCQDLLAAEGVESFGYAGRDELGPNFVVFTVVDVCRAMEVAKRVRDEFGVEMGIRFDSKA
jgi:hypothetical protein